MISVNSVPAPEPGTSLGRLQAPTSIGGFEGVGTCSSRQLIAWIASESSGAR